MNRCTCTPFLPLHLLHTQSFGHSIIRSQSLTGLNNRDNYSKKKHPYSSRVDDCIRCRRIAVYEFEGFKPNLFFPNSL